MKFSTKIIREMPPRAHRTFNALIRAWNRLNPDLPDIGPLRPDDDRTIEFSGEALAKMRMDNGIRKGLNIFGRAYRAAEAATPASPPSKSTSKVSGRKKAESTEEN